MAHLAVDSERAPPSVPGGPYKSKDLRSASALDPPRILWTVVAFNIIREKKVHMSTVSLFWVNSSKLVTKDGCGHPRGWCPQAPLAWDVLHFWLFWLTRKLYKCVTVAYFVLSGACRHPEIQRRSNFVVWWWMFQAIQLWNPCCIILHTPHININKTNKCSFLIICVSNQDAT